nr:hypothetical protein [Salinadaptatus halalkaliphilus]
MALEQLEHADGHIQECIDNCLEAAQVCAEVLPDCVESCREMAAG